MSSYPEFVAEDRRLVIVRVLSDQPEFALNDSVLQTALERFGHGVSRDVVRGDLAWLEEAGLVELEALAERVTVARLTQRGSDVATGRARVPGVKRPGPRG